jgi:hypothetical protein
MLLHDISQSALAAAVFTLGVVIMLELRAIGRLRQSLDRDLGRVFEQLDLLRIESQQLLEGQAKGQAPPSVPVVHSVPPTARGDEISAAVRLAARGAAVQDISERCGLAKGEARLLVALQTARAQRSGMAG